MNKKSFTFNTYEDDLLDTPCTTLPNSNYTSFCNNSSQSSPDHSTDSISDNSKKIRKKRCTYQKIDDETRIKLLDAVHEGETLKAAAKKYNINYSSAKSILHTFRKEGRILKKSAQERTARRRTKNSSDLEMSPIYPYKQTSEDYNTIPEVSTYQTYHSPDSQHSPGYNQENFKTEIGGVSVNSFGGFYKVDSQSQQNIENMSKKTSPTNSTVVFQLNSSGLQKLPSSNTSSIQSKNFQINVNVQKQNPETAPMPVITQQYEAPNPLKLNEKIRSFEGYYYQPSPAPMQQGGNPMRREEPRFDKYYNQEFDSFANMMTCQEEVDVSCFLTPASPVYNFQQQKTQPEPEYYRANVDFSALNQNRRISEPQEQQLYYENPRRMAVMGYKADDGTSGYAKTAGLRGY